MARVRTDLAPWFLFAVSVLLPSSLAAQAELYEGKQIVTIQFEPREQPIEAEEIHRILPLKINTALRMEDVRQAIHRLYATGQYSDVQVDAEVLEGGVAIRFLTSNSWFIGRVSADKTISEPPNAGQMVNATGLRLGEAYKAEGIIPASDSLQHLLESNGYYESRIEPRFEYEPRTQQIHIHFVVDSGRRGVFAPPQVSGDLKMSAEDITRFTKWHGLLGWRPVTLARTQRGIDLIRRKYQQQDRLMAKVILQGMEYDPETRKVRARIEIDAGPKVEVRTIGAKVSRGRLVRLIPVFEEGTVDRDLLAEGAQNLRDYFQSDGYFNAEVEFKQSRVVRDRAQIDYLVNLGPRQQVISVEVKGNNYFDTQTIRERMFVLPRSFQFRRGRYSESLLRRDVESITNLYRENGFREAEVRGSATDVVNDDRGLAVTLNINEGQQWLISKFELEGVQELNRDDLLVLITSQEGQPFSEYQIAVDRDAILARYYSEGFSEASFTWSSNLLEDSKRVELKFVIREGPQLFVRQVLVSGLQTTEPDFLNRNLLLNPGDPLSVTRMAETQQRLYDLGIFARVNVAIQNPEGETANKYVLYQVEEANRYSVTGGLGAELGRIGGGQTTLASPAGSTGFSPRVSLDVSRLNFRGIGHTLSFRSRLSNIQQRGLINYSAPRLRNVQGQDLSFTLLVENSGDVRTFVSRRREGSVQLSQRLSKANTALYRFSYRRVGVDNLKIFDPLLIPLLSQPVRIGILSGNFIQDKRDDPTDATRGVYNTLDAGLAANFFGSQEDFGRILARNATYHAFGKRLVFARSLTLGWILPFDVDPAAREANTDIPLPERFFSGGANTHRGFPENQAGPRDASTGFPIGGRALLMNTLEMRFPLLGGNLGGVVFHDAGNVFSRLENISLRFRQRDQTDFDYMVHAIGFGVRYRTPIGPVRLDLAYSVNSPKFRGCSITNSLTECGPPVDQRISRFQFHFSIGQAF